MKARTRRIIQGSDYSAQEPRLLSQLCGDEGMLQAYRDGIMVSPNLDVHIKNLYEVSNIDKSEVIKCKGREGVSNLIGIAEKTIRPGLIKSGPYKGYTIENTHIRIEQPVIFKKQISNVSASSVNC